MNVLVIDDEERTIDLLRRALRLVGHRVIGACNSAELQALVSSQSASRIDAVLLDDCMPGCECTEMIRTLRAWGDKLPVLLVTDCGTRNTDQGTVEQSDGVIEKPFDLDELEQALRGVQVRARSRAACRSEDLPGQNGRGRVCTPPAPKDAQRPKAVEEKIPMNEPAQRVPSASPRRKRILLVDDTETVLMFEKLMLGSYGYEIRVARDGTEALALTKEWKPDVVLLDIMMPKLDGIQTCRALKTDPETSSLPVIMVTTRGEPEKVEEAFVAGCDDYLTKPLDRLELLVKIRSFLR